MNKILTLFTISFLPVYLCTMVQAVDLKAYNKRGLEYEKHGDINSAFRIYEEAMHINPNFIEARFHDGVDPERFDVKKLGLPENCLKWNGEDLTGKSILVYSEKGLGDTIQFSRFVPLLKSKMHAKFVFFKPQSPLVNLFEKSDFNLEILGADANLSLLKTDYYVSVLSLPHLLNLDVKDVPAKSGYLNADKKRVENFKQKFFDNSDFKIGICWQGDPNHVNDKNRSMKLAELYPLPKIPGVSVYSLQKNYGAEQLNDVPSDIHIIDLGCQVNDFDDTAAIIENLDVFIGVDTALVHLSGALNKKTILLLSDSVDWRWFCYSTKDKDYNPWYTCLTKIRQTRSGAWTDVVEQVVGMINNLKKV